MMMTNFRSPRWKKVSGIKTNRRKRQFDKNADTCFHICFFVFVFVPTSTHQLNWTDKHSARLNKHFFEQEKRL